MGTPIQEAKWALEKAEQAMKELELAISETYYQVEEVQVVNKDEIESLAHKALESLEFSDLSDEEEMQDRIWQCEKLLNDILKELEK